MRTRLALVALAALSLTACGDDGNGDDEGSADKKPSVLVSAYDKCAPEIDSSMQENFQEDAPAIEEVMRIEDDGDSLIVTTPDPGGEIASSLALVATNCVLKETDAPATVSANMSTTNALAGSQTADWDNIEVVWSYSAGASNAGFNATFAVTD